MRTAREFAHHRPEFDDRAVALLAAPRLAPVRGLPSRGLKTFPNAFALAEAVRAIMGIDEQVQGYGLNAGTSDWLGWRARFDPKSRRMEFTLDTVEELERLALRMPIWAAGARCSHAEVTAFMVLVHECFHVLSPLSWSDRGLRSYFLTIEVAPEYRACYPRDVLEGPGHFVEEGLVQFLAEGAVARWLFAGTAPAEHLRGWSYRTESAAVGWFAEEFGMRALGEVWTLPTGEARAACMERYVARWLKDRIAASGVHPAVFRDWLERRRHPSLWEMLFVANCRVFGNDLPDTFACLRDCFPALRRGTHGS